MKPRPFHHWNPTVLMWLVSHLHVLRNHQHQIFVSSLHSSARPLSSNDCSCKLNWDGCQMESCQWAYFISTWYSYVKNIVVPSLKTVASKNKQIEGIIQTGTAFEAFCILDRFAVVPPAIELLLSQHSLTNALPTHNTYGEGRAPWERWKVILFT